jgi:hypothetical protein
MIVHSIHKGEALFFPLDYKFKKANKNFKVNANSQKGAPTF